MKASRKYLGKAVHVEWEDSYQATETRWMQRDEIKVEKDVRGVICHTYGEIVRSSYRAIVVAQNQTEEQVSGIMVIPWPAIIKIKVLK